MLIVALNVLFMVLLAMANAQNDKIDDRPNIVIILADDMGINDVSFRGSDQIITPNIDSLAYNGVILDKYYVPNICTPSRATLLTGKFPIHTGTQHYVIPNSEPWGLPLNHKLLPEIFRDAGYSTNLVGKWHLGFSKKSYTPTLRGYDYHYGYYGGYIDYFDHSLIMLTHNYSRGYDFRRNLDVNYDGNGTYATDLFTNEAMRVIENHNKSKPLLMVLSHLAVHAGNEDDPMQAPMEAIEKFNFIKDPQRRTYAAMISKLDESVGKVMRSLSENNMINNTIVLFYSDNGAPTVGLHSNGGSNSPLKGQKETPWEGGIRSAGCIWSPLIKARSRLLNQVMYSADWLPTLAKAAGIELDINLNLDGIDMWDSVVNNRNERERRLVHTIDDIFQYSSYMRGNMKYVNGTRYNGDYDNWIGKLSNEIDPQSVNYTKSILESEVSKVLQNSKLTSETITNLRQSLIINCPKISKYEGSDSEKYLCRPLIEPCLFNLTMDPCEKYNLAKISHDKMIEMEIDINYFRQNAAKPARIPISDDNCDPRRYNFTWTWWEDLQSNNNTNNSSNHNSIKNCLFQIIFILILTRSILITLF